MPFPDAVDGGVIVRDEGGYPTGLFGSQSVSFGANGWNTHLGVLLDNAQELLKQPEITESDLLRRFKVAVRDAHALGLTSIHDAGLDPVSLTFFKR